MNQDKYLTDQLSREDVEDCMKECNIGWKQCYNILNGRSKNFKFIDLLLAKAEYRRAQLIRSMRWQQELKQFNQLVNA